MHIDHVKTYLLMELNLGALQRVENRYDGTLWDEPTPKTMAGAPYISSNTPRLSEVTFQNEFLLFWCHPHAT